MSARRQLIAALAEDHLGGIATLADVDHAEQLVDAHQAEVLTADGQAYDGELAMYRQLVRTLRTVVREDVDTAEVWRLLHSHAGDDAAAREETKEKATADATPATPDFFQAGHTYTQNLPYCAPEIRPNFRCVGIGDHPSKGSRRAFGFEQSGAGAIWVSSSMRDEEWADGWTDVTDTTTPKDRP